MANKAASNPGPSFDDDVRARANRLLQNHSQAEIARKTGTTRANVNQYLKSTRIPAWFCSALAHGLNVNPTWLLTGEGKIYLTDVSEHADKMSDDLLEVVNAMKSITRMKLGAIASDDSLESLRKLDEAVKSHEHMSAKLDTQVNDLLQELIANTQRARENKNWENLQHNIKAARQAAKFSRNADLLLELDKIDAHSEIMQGDWHRGIALQRSVLMRTIGQNDQVGSEFCTMVHNYALVLLFSFRIQAARQVLLAALGLIKGRKAPELRGRRHQLNVLLSHCEVSLGISKPGLQRMLHHFPLMHDKDQESLEFLMIRTQVLAGHTSLESTLERKPKSERLRAEHVALSALLANDQDIVRRTLRQIPGKSGQDFHGIHKGLFIFAECLAENSQRKAPKLVENLRSYYASLADDQQFRSIKSAVEVVSQIQSTALFLAAKRFDEAVNTLLQANTLMKQLPEECSVPLLLLAPYHRDAIIIGQEKPKLREASKLAKEAKRFFKRMHKRGFFGLTKMLPS